MPFCTVSTNLSSKEIPPEFASEFAHQVAVLLDKRIESVTVTMHSDIPIFRNGTTAPALVAEISSIRTFTYEKTSVYAENVRRFVNEKLGLEHESVGVVFHELKPEQVGLNVAPTQN